MKAFKVSVDYQTITGNPATARIKVMAHNEDDAGSRAIERVRKYKTCLKIEGGDVADYYPPKTPAPIDWGKELEKIGNARKKAISDLKDICREKVGLVWVQFGNLGYNRIRMQGELIYLAKGPSATGARHLYELQTEDIIRVLMALQAEIASK